MKITFLTWRPWPSTYDLDLRTCPRYHQGHSLYQILWSCVKRFRHETAHTPTDTHTDTHTDGTVSITSTANAGVNKDLPVWALISCNTRGLLVTIPEPRGKKSLKREKKQLIGLNWYNKWHIKRGGEPCSVKGIHFNFKWLRHIWKEMEWNLLAWPLK